MISTSSTTITGSETTSETASDEQLDPQHTSDFLHVPHPPQDFPQHASHPQKLPITMNLYSHVPIRAPIIGAIIVAQFNMFVPIATAGLRTPIPPVIMFAANSPKTVPFQL